MNNTPHQPYQPGGAENNGYMLDGKGNIIMKVSPELNKQDSFFTYSTAFSVNFVLLVADKNPEIVRNRMETLANKISEHYKKWNLLPNDMMYY